MIVKIKNKSNREIPEELANACNQSLSEINRIAEEYNLRVIEFEKEFDKNGNVSSQIITIASV